jgi:hypothetical protein
LQKYIFNYYRIRLSTYMHSHIEGKGLLCTWLEASEHSEVMFTFLLLFVLCAVLDGHMNVLWEAGLGEAA